MGSLETIQWAAERRYPFCSVFTPVDNIKRMFSQYREHCDRIGYTPHPEQLGFAAGPYVAETDAKAVEEIEEHALQFYNNVSAPAQKPEMQAINAGRHTERSFAYKTQAHAHMPRGDDGLFARVQNDGLLVTGSPDTVTRKIREQQAALGVGVYLTYLPFGTLEPKHAMKSLELFAKEVMPNLKD